MKAHQQQSNASGTGAKTKSGCDKIQNLKAGSHINKSSGNVAAKRRKGADFSPFESHIGSKIAQKTGNLMEAPFSDANKSSARPPNHSGRIKLQLFPIDESIQEIMQQEKHNPYLELTLAPRKKMSSIVQHLNTKWGSSQCAKGELMLFPNDTRLDTIDNSAKWTLEDNCTAADVHVTVGSPSTFRLRFNLFSIKVTGNSIATMTSSILCAIPETGTDDQQCSTDGRKEELIGQTSVLGDDINARPEISTHESAGDPEPGASCPRLLSRTDSIGLSCLLTDSLDAFQKFSVF